MRKRDGTRITFFAVQLVVATVAAGCAGSPLDTPSEPAGYERLTAGQAQALIDAHKDDARFVILDVRTSDEFAAGHIANAANVCVCATPSFAAAIEGLDTSAKYLVYCRSGRRSTTAVTTMQDMGFSDLSELAGGLLDWQASGQPLVR